MSVYDHTGIGAQGRLGLGTWSSKTSKKDSWTPGPEDFIIEDMMLSFII